MKQPNETQTRCVEVRAAEKPLTLTGVAVVFNQPADLGGVKEVIAPDALRGVNLDDIVLITNHDGGQIPLPTQAAGSRRAFCPA